MELCFHTIFCAHMFTASMFGFDSGTSDSVLQCNKINMEIRVIVIK